MGRVCFRTPDKQKVREGFLQNINGGLMIAGLHPHGRFQLSGHLPEEPYSIMETVQEAFRNPSGVPFQPILLQFHYQFFNSFIKKTVWFTHSITLPDTHHLYDSYVLPKGIIQSQRGEVQAFEEKTSFKREREWRIP